MQDHLIRATAQGIRAFAAVTTNLVEEARVRHDCYPVAAAALGRTLTASLLLAANLKSDESLTIKIAGNGGLGDIVADAKPDGTVRGYVKNPHVDLPLRSGKLDVGKAVGEGHIYVTRFTGLRHPFTGSSPLISGEIAEDITNYLLVSEQTSSSVGLGVLVQPDLSVIASGGFLIQALPEADEAAIAKLETNLAAIQPVSQMVHNGYAAQQIVEQIFKDMTITFYDEQNLFFRCPCSEERVQNMLISLGEQELQEMLAEGQAEVTCHFCNEKYRFDTAVLAGMLDTVRQKK